MLFLGKGSSNLLRGQGTYLSDDEIDQITEIVSTGEQNFVNELVNIKVKSEDEDLADDDAPKKLENRDELYEQAISVVVQEQRGSCSLLQRAMGIGYGRAARLIDFMAEDGYVGPYNGSKAREVMMTEDQWANIQAGDPNPVSDEDWIDETPDDVKAALETEPEEPKVRLKPRKLERIEPGQKTHLSANVSFAPKKRKAKKKEKVVEDDELEEEVDSIAEDDPELSAGAKNHDVDEYEDEEEYEDIDDDAEYEEEEEEFDDEEEADEYEDEDNDEECEDAE